MSELLNWLQIKCLWKPFHIFQAWGPTRGALKISVLSGGETGGGGATRQDCAVEGGRGPRGGLPEGGAASPGDLCGRARFLHAGRPPLLPHDEGLLESTQYTYFVRFTPESWSPTLTSPGLYSLVLPGQGSVSFSEHSHILLFRPDTQHHFHFPTLVSFFMVLVFTSTHTHTFFLRT